MKKILMISVLSLSSLILFSQENEEIDRVIRLELTKANILKDSFLIKKVDGELLSYIFSYIKPDTGGIIEEAEVESGLLTERVKKMISEQSIGYPIYFEKIMVNKNGKEIEAPVIVVKIK